MSLKNYTSSVNLIKNSQKILCITHGSSREEDFMSVLALHVFLTRAGKKITSVVPSQKDFNRLNFLIGKESIAKNIPALNEYEILIKGSNIKIKNIQESNDSKENLSILLTKDSGSINSEDLFFQKKSPDFDLIITVNVSDLDAIGKNFENHTKLFSQTPILNISSDIQNDFFGKLPLIDLEKSSTMEIIYDLVQAYPNFEKHLDKALSSIFLSGIIRSTDSFLESATTPKLLKMAAEINEKGVDHSEIIESLFKKHSLQTLKIWGEILQNLKFDATQKINWSHVDLGNFDFPEKISEDLGNISEVLLRFVKGSDLSLLSIQRNKNITFVITTDNPSIDLENLTKSLGGTIEKYGVRLVISEMDFLKSEAKILKILSDHQIKRLDLTQNLELKSEKPQKTPLKNQKNKEPNKFALEKALLKFSSEPKIPKTEPFIAPLQPDEKTGKIG